MRKKDKDLKNMQPENVGAVHTHTHTQVFLNNLNNNKRAGTNSALKVINKKEIHGLKV